MYWKTYLSSGTTRESRGTSRSSRSLKNKDTVLADIHKDNHKFDGMLQYSIR